jgi:hypothetical protein
VLNEIHSNLQTRRIHYWRDKRGHEADFVVAPARGRPVAIECKWSTRDFDPRNLVAFHGPYPSSTLLVVGHDVDRAYVRSYRGVQVSFVSLLTLIERLARRGRFR